MAFSKCISGNDGKLSCTPQPPGSPSSPYTPSESYDPGYNSGRPGARFGTLPPPNGYYPWEMPEWNQHGNVIYRDRTPQRAPAARRSNPPKVGRPVPPNYSTL
jgi:hypothetical protein